MMNSKYCGRAGVSIPVNDPKSDVRISFLVALAACTPISLALPWSNSSNAPTILAMNSSSPYDPVYRYLASNDQLDWTVMNGGHGVTILSEDWVAAKEATGFKNMISKRNGGGGNEGPINGLVPNVFCYHSGSTTKDDTIQLYTIKACDALLQMSLPKPAVNALQVWQSSGFANSDGILSKLRYGFQILNGVSDEPDQSLCQQAMDLYLQYCQSCRFIAFIGK